MVRQLNEALSCGGRQELGGQVVGRAGQGRSAHHVPAQAVHSFWVSIFKTIVDHWCPKSENHQKTIESNGLGAENH